MRWMVRESEQCGAEHERDVARERGEDRAPDR